MTPDLQIAAALTFAGSAHCAGMCGPFVLALAAGPPRQRLARGFDHALMQVGKASSYAFLGAMAGAFGAALAGSTLLSWVGRGLAIVAAAALAAAGLSLLGLRGQGHAPEWLTGLYQRAVTPLLGSRPPGFPLVVGLLMGLLPCPLVYAGLAAAAASGDALRGALILAGVALGTLPVLALVAASGSVASASLRRHLARAAGILLLAAAAVTAVRGLPLHDHASHHGSPPQAAPTRPGHPDH